MSETCDIEACKRASCALCHCCKQNVCRPHLNEHQDLLNSQLNPLVDQINAIGDRLKTININTMMDDCRQELDKWRMNSHRMIDDLFEQKRQELEEHVTKKVNKRREEIGRVRSKVSELIRDEDATRQKIELLTSTVHDLERDINKLEHMSIHVKSRSLVIDGNMIEIEEGGGNQFNLSTFAPVYSKTDRPRSGSSALGSNGRFLLMNKAPNLCLIDRNLIVTNEVKWSYETLRDICWSSALDQFIVINENGVFLVDEKTMLIKKMKTNEKRAWSSCTCSNTSLFLSTHELGSSIVEYSVLPSITFTREWKSPDTCQKEEWINDMKYNNQTLALVMKIPSDITLRIELKNSQTLACLWSLRLDMGDTKARAFHCCLVNNDEWLVMDHEASRLLHITNDGKLKSTHAYNEVPWNANIFGPDIIAISTDTQVNFHKF